MHINNFNFIQNNYTYCDQDYNIYCELLISVMMDTQLYINVV